MRHQKKRGTVSHISIRDNFSFGGSRLMFSYSVIKRSNIMRFTVTYRNLMCDCENFQNILYNKVGRSEIF